MENIFKELFLLPSQGVSLSIADAKVDTFILLTKHYHNFFTRFFNNKSQNADLQTKLRNDGSEKHMDFARYMLQNMKFLKKYSYSSETQKLLQTSPNLSIASWFIILML